ncbi:MAG: PLP-dependent transferase [Candidatus Marinimicrobia bacterium]|nr:PLP-dependent transferase [Candidatus Neomarinimicrobiota bacterium]
MKDIQNKGIDTLVTHGGINPDRTYGSAAPPIYQTSTFSFESANQGARRFADEEAGYIYTRLGNPTINALEEAVATLEGGYGALATSSGMAAITTVFMTFLEQSAHIVSTNSVYAPSRVVVEKEFSRFGVEYDFVDTANPEEIKKHLRLNTKLIYIETPSNPTIKLTDIQACADIAHKHGALLVVDNTFMTPVLQRPFDFGADIVIHSMTKALNGHTDVVAGIIVSRKEELHLQVRRVLRFMGGTMDPHQSWLVLRGLRTLALRVEKAQSNAQKLAVFLEDHPKVKWVRYPGLQSHPQHQLALDQMKGSGFMISFEVRGGAEAGRTIMDNVEIPTLAVSLGGYESLIQHPASMTHAGMSKECQEKAGIADGLVRLSVGCEDANDLLADLGRCLALI